jgi:hypothetical protein
MITATLKRVKFDFFFQSIILTGHKNYKFSAIKEDVIHDLLNGT